MARVFVPAGSRLVSTRFAPLKKERPMSRGEADRSVCATALVLTVALLPLSAQTLVIDGRLEDAFWTAVQKQKLQPEEAGVAADMGGTFALALRGNWLCFAAQMPEAGGKILARAFGPNAVWQKDAYGAPPVEDRLEYRIHYGEHVRTIGINPWGGYRIEQDGAETRDPKIEVAAIVSSTGWTVEACLPLGSLDLAGSGSSLRWRAERIRSRRPLAPEFHWSYPAKDSEADLPLPESALIASALTPAFRPPALGNTEPPVEIGRVLSVPSLSTGWDDAAWKIVPSFSLPRNEPYPRAPHRGTEVKWVQDGHTLALLMRAEESEPLVARSGGRDASFATDDHLALYLATSSSSYIEIMVNTVGGVRDSLVRGGPHMSGLQAGWNADIKAQTDIRYGSWTARIDVPLLECARALGESKIPDSWRFVLARYRAARPGDPAETSALPAIGTRSFDGPMRYQKLVLSNRAPSQIMTTGQARPNGPVGELAALDSHVWSSFYRRSHQVRTMVTAQQNHRSEADIVAERAAWDRITNRAEWETFRDKRITALREAAGLPEVHTPNDVRITSRRGGKGYQLVNLVYQSRPGLYVPANLYLPDKPPASMPAIIIIHSFHYPNSQGELRDMGALWARTGCAVLVPEWLGFGERVETSPWYRVAYGSRALFREQLNLVGQSLIGWRAWDAIRAVDMLLERPDIDPKRIILMGAVAGGGEPAAVAAALDPRISALVAYNYDHGRVRLDADFFGELPRQFDMSLVANSLAPRHYVRASEFGWEGAAEPDFPDLWVSAWERNRKVWGFYGAGKNLASATGYGLIRLSMDRVSHAWSIGPQHRRDLYSIFQRWFNIPLPSAEDLAILPDSELSVNPYREEARRQEAVRLRPLADLVVISPDVSAGLPRKSMHQVAYQMAEGQLVRARSDRAKLDTRQARAALQQALRAKLGDIEPAASPKAEVLRSQTLSIAKVDAVALQVEPGIEVPLLLLRPTQRVGVGVVVAIGKQGKERFLASRFTEIEALLRAGVAVCLPDLRGTGETAPEPDWQNNGENLAQMEVALGNTLLGARVKDLRTVLAYLRGGKETDASRIAVWGDSFAPANPKDLFLDELEQEVGPQIQYHAEELGASAALLAGLFEPDLRAVATHGGLASYLSVVEHAFAYLPMDAVVPGLLQVADVVDIAAAQAPRPLLLEALVDGRNVRLTSGELSGTFSSLTQAYEKHGARGHLTLRAEPGGVATWLAAQLQ
jgi:dienelactone hydrolase